MLVFNYKMIAQENEVVFRNILRDMKANRIKRPMRMFIPSNLETELEIEAFVQKYSAGERMGKFTIDDFRRSKELAVISFNNVAPLSGGGAQLEYLVKPDNAIEYYGASSIFRC